MKRPIIRGWLTLLATPLLMPGLALALTCKTQGAGDSVVRADLSSTVAIPANLPDGSAVWRSERLNLAVECARDEPGGPEDVFIDLNPDNLQIGQGIRAEIGRAHV